MKERLSITAILVALLTVVPAWAQVSTASLQGTVRDQTDAVIPGVEVTVINLGTGATRTVVSDEVGRYNVPALAVGSYEVQAQLPGFRTFVRRGITLAVGQSAVVNVTLEVGDIAEVIEVTAQAQLVDTTSSDLSQLVDSRTMQELPLNGRNYAQLATLQAGVTFAGRGAAPSTITGPGMRFNVSGTRFDSNAFLLDGQDIQDTFNQTPSSGGGDTLGVDTLEEFEVKTANYSAEYGKASGAVINAVTKSGSNEFHGSAFWFHRNDNLDASNFFDNAFGREQPEFKRNQFGATLGGPIVPNRTFFFAGYEGLREGLGTTQRLLVPTEDAIRGIVDGQQIPISPAVQPYLALFPLRPNGQILPGGRGEHFRTETAIKDQDFFVVRIDQQLGTDHSLNFRYSYDKGEFIQPSGTVFASNLPTLNQYLSGSMQSIFSPNIVNSLTIGFNRSRLEDVDVPLIDIPSSLFYPGFPAMGQLNVSGFSGNGVGTLRPRDFLQQIYEFKDTLSWTIGSHQLKLGGNVQLYRPDVLNALWLTGSYSFTSWANFLRGNARTFLGGDPSADFVRNFRQTLVGAFVQDDIRLTQRLTLNLGLRYEPITVPTDTEGRISNLRRLTDSELTLGDPLYDNPSLTNFSPRVGFAWDVFGNGRTAIRGAGGIFYNQILANQYRFMVTGNPPSGTLFAIRPPFPNAADAAGARPPTIHHFPFDLDQPTIYQWNLNVQQELLPETVLRVGYVGTRGVHLGRSQSGQDANTAVPAIVDGRKFWPDVPGGLPRRNPNFDTIRALFYDANSFYHGLQVDLRSRVADGLQLQTSYTYSKSIDEASGIWGGSGVGQTSPQDMHDRRAERGPSGFDVRHNFVFNGTWLLPVTNSTGALSTLVNGWELSGIVSLSTGLPFTVTVAGDADPDRDQSTSDLRPDLLPGKDSNPKLGRPEKWFDPGSFAPPAPGFQGNLGRNTLRADGFQNVDLAVKKNTALGESVNMQFRAELFNVFNHANFDSPSVTELFLPNSTVPRQDAGIVTSTVNPARQIQFGLRFIW